MKSNANNPSYASDTAMLHPGYKQQFFSAFFAPLREIMASGIFIGPVPASGIWQ
jgi:hypothetical protein